VVLLESTLKNGEGAEHGVTAVLQRVQLAQCAAGHLPSKAALADLVAGRRVLVHHLVHRAGLVEEIEALPQAVLKLLDLVQHLQNPARKKNCLLLGQPLNFKCLPFGKRILTHLYSW